jgi:hypothetical protein
MSVIIQYIDETGINQDILKVLMILDVMLYSELYKNKRILSITITS